MKKSKLITLLIIFIIIIFPLIVNATQINPDDYKPKELTSGEADGINSFGGKIAGVIQIVGTMVSVGTMIIIGIKYVVASVDEKAEYKERIFPYLIGAILLFGASNLVNIAYKIFS